MDKEIFSFPVLWDGWDCDYTAWVMQRPDGSKYLCMTNHGGRYEAPISQLERKIKEYNSVIAQSEKALELIAEG